MKLPPPRLALFMSIVIVSSFSRIAFVEAKKHHLSLEDDSRRLIHITSFGFFKGGFMEVKVNEIYLQPGIDKTNEKNKQTVGFTVDRTLKDGINPYPHDVETSCALSGGGKPQDDASTSSILFSIDFAAKLVNVVCSSSLLPHVHVYRSTTEIPYTIQGVPRIPRHFPNPMTQPQRKRRNVDDIGTNIKGEDKNLDAATVNPVPVAGASLSEPVKDPKTAQVKQVESVVGKDAEVVDDSDKKSLKKDKETAAANPDADDLGLMEDASKETIVDENKKAISINNLAQQPVADNVNNADENALSGPGNCIGPIPLNATVLANLITSYSFTFVVYIGNEIVEGLYNLYFHNCADNLGSRVTLNVNLVEENLNKNYLSAGEMPLPALYFMMSVLFCMSGCFWFFILKKSKRETGVSVFKIHYLMGALVFFKSLSLLFHSINYHFIQVEGGRKEGWAVLYYITHLLKGALLFITILLIGTGYAFVKHLLSDKDKKIFMIVIPLQVLANVAQIIIEESEEGEVVHTTWQVIFISVDLLCCCAILFPVVWSIRHLQEASQTDGKAASNLRKLKLFRHFYIIVVCYIYFTRIIVQMLLRITVPFQYEWLDDMFREMTTFIFFVLTGYKFRPAANNPYLELAHDSEDEEMDTVITDSGLTEGAVKRGYKPRKKTLKEIVLFDPNEEETDDDEEVLLEKRREASHDLD